MNLEINLKISIWIKIKFKYSICTKPKEKTISLNARNSIAIKDVNSMSVEIVAYSGKKNTLILYEDAQSSFSSANFTGSILYLSILSPYLYWLLFTFRDNFIGVVVRNFLGILYYTGILYYYIITIYYILVTAYTLYFYSV